MPGLAGEDFIFQRIGIVEYIPQLFCRNCTLGHLPASRQTSRKTLVEQNISIQTCQHSTSYQTTSCRLNIRGVYATSLSHTFIIHADMIVSIPQGTGCTGKTSNENTFLMAMFSALMTQIPALLKKFSLWWEEKRRCSCAGNKTGSGEKRIAAK